jgi:hypothetical protein
VNVDLRVARSGPLPYPSSALFVRGRVAARSAVGRGTLGLTSYAGGSGWCRMTPPGAFGATLPFQGRNRGAAGRIAAAIGAAYV